MSWNRNRRMSESPDIPVAGLVEFPRSVDRRFDVAYGSGHERYLGGDRFNLQLDLRIEALSPVRIGSGFTEMDAKGLVYQSQARRNGVPVIPGSSLKGMVRSIVEAISDSCVNKVDSKVTKLPRALGECKVDKDSDITGICPACFLFGCMGYMGRVFFEDALPESNSTVTEIVKIPYLYGPRNSQKGRKFYFHGKRAGGKQEVEAIKKGSIFNTRLTVESLGRAELHLLLVALGEIGGLVPKLGGGKPGCLGSVRMEVTGAIMYDPLAYFRDGETETKRLDRKGWLEFRDWVTAAEDSGGESLVNVEALQKLRSILRYPRGDRSCPTGSYRRSVRTD